MLGLCTGCMGRYDWNEEYGEATLVHIGLQICCVTIHIELMRMHNQSCMTTESGLDRRSVESCRMWRTWGNSVLDLGSSCRRQWLKCRECLKCLNRPKKTFWTWTASPLTALACPNHDTSRDHYLSATELQKSGDEVQSQLASSRQSHVSRHYWITITNTNPDSSSLDQVETSVDILRGCFKPSHLSLESFHTSPCRLPSAWPFLPTRRALASGHSFSEIRHDPSSKIDVRPLDDENVLLQGSF